MDPKKVSIKRLEKVLQDLQTSSDEAIGNYLYKGYRIQVSKYKSSGTERYMRLYRKRREQGLCVRCGEKVTKKIPIPANSTGYVISIVILLTRKSAGNSGFLKKLRGRLIIALFYW